MRIHAILALPILAACLAAPALACGPDTDCDVAGGTYRIHLPPEAPTGAILFAHGYKGHAADAMANAALTVMADDLDVALVSLESTGDDWTIPERPERGHPAGTRRDCLRPRRPKRRRGPHRGGAVADDLRRVLRGGMLTWNVACEAGGGFAALVAFSGTFWEGPPAHCAADARMWHFHGTSDTVVPIGGRQIGPVRQGDVDSVLDFYRMDKGMAPTAPIPVADLDCRAWSGPDASLEYCLHPGGDAEWLRIVWEATFPDG